MSLKARLQDPAILVAPGIYDGLTAHLRAVSSSENRPS